MIAPVHSVTLIKDWCKGCTNCLKRCPTEAIRVRKGKAVIISNRCIDCGECIRICPHHAKKAVYDNLDILKKFEYTIAMPAPSLYGQFPKAKNISDILNAILKLGFDEVFEVSKAAEYISEATLKFINEGNHKKPVISSACPSITRLIQLRFPELIENLLPVITPVELAGLLAKKNAVIKTGLPPEKIGTIFLSPCPAKVSTINNPIGIEKSGLDGAIAIKEVYPFILNQLSKAYNNPDEIVTSGSIGVSWGISGGEASASLEDRYLAADGIENCIRVLESLENKRLAPEFIELNACPGGCVGGVLTVENPFIATVKLKSLRKDLPISLNQLNSLHVPDELKWNTDITYKPAMELDKNISNAISKLAEIDSITQNLRGLDCGSCGSPSCRAFAEDIVQGHCVEDDCIFVLRESMHNIAQTLAKLSSLDNGKEDDD